MTTLPQILLSKLAADARHQDHPGRLRRVHAQVGIGSLGQSLLRYALLALRRRLDQQWHCGEVVRGGRLTLCLSSALSRRAPAPPQGGCGIRAQVFAHDVLIRRPHEIGLGAPSRNSSRILAGNGLPIIRLSDVAIVWSHRSLRCLSVKPKELWFRYFTHSNWLTTTPSACVNRDIANKCARTSRTVFHAITPRH